MPIQLNRLSNTAAARHTVEVELPLAEGTEKIRVVYRGRSIRDGLALEQKYEGRDPNEALPEVLAEDVVELPDIKDGDQPVEPTAEFFSTLDLFVLHRIARAIREDRTAANPSRA